MTVATRCRRLQLAGRGQDSAISAISWSPSRIGALLVRNDQPVGIAVERDAEVGAVRHHLALHGSDGSRRTAC